MLVLYYRGIFNTSKICWQLLVMYLLYTYFIELIKLYITAYVSIYVFFVFAYVNFQQIMISSFHFLISLVVFLSYFYKLKKYMKRRVTLLWKTKIYTIQRWHVLIFYYVGSTCERRYQRFYISRHITVNNGHFST